MTNVISNDDLITYITEVMRSLPKNYNDDNKKSKNSTWIIVLLIIVIVIVVVILLLYVYNKDKDSKINAQMMYNMKMINDLYNNQLYLNNQRDAMIDYRTNQMNTAIDYPKVEEINDDFVILPYNDGYNTKNRSRTQAQWTP